MYPFYAQADESVIVKKQGTIFLGGPVHICTAGEGGEEKGKGVRGKAGGTEGGEGAHIRTLAVQIFIPSSL